MFSQLALLPQRDVQNTYSIISHNGMLERLSLFKCIFRLGVFCFFCFFLYESEALPINFTLYAWLHWWGFDSKLVSNCLFLLLLIFTMYFFFFRTDPVRPFISGHVANSMAAEVIALLHSLLMAPESNAAQIWTTTAEKVKSHRLCNLCLIKHHQLLSN